MLGCGACVLVPGMLRMFFALALMPFAVEMVVKPCLKKYVIRGYLIHTYDMPEEPADPEHLRKNLLMRFLCVDDSFIAV